MFLRYWLPIEPQAESAGPLASLSDIGFAYFLCFNELRKEMRVVPSSYSSLLPNQMFTGRWTEFQKYALTVVPLTFTNVVIGPPNVYRAKYTAQAFIKNLAICACLVEENLPSGLSDYQYVWAHREEDKRILSAAGIKSELVPPNLKAVEKNLPCLS